jgi:hypothetical protein
MRKISAIFKNSKGSASISTNSPNSEAMAAIILTRWAKRRLNVIREVNILKHE